ncbi:MAG: hypothetical protein LIO86_12600 [Lachnospiraceae bacterium]|nr:hypothetical protein [Lachnospiraceae bacterium]
MLKKLKRSFVLINMTIITLMLFLVFGTITYFTQSNLREKNVQMMSEIAANPFRTTWSGDSDVSLPYFVVQITGGRIIVAVND